jgi:hypothetical protein
VVFGLIIFLEVGMMSRKTLRSLERGFGPVMAIAAALLLALAFTGCGGDNGEEDPFPPTEWTAVTGGPFGTTAIQKVVFGNNKFVATGNGGSAWYSADGVAWTASANKTALGTSNISGLTFGDGKFLATGGSSNNKDWAYSTDGNIWTATGLVDTNFNAKGLAYGNGVYLIGGSNGIIAYSSNLSSWISLTATATTFNKEGGNGFVNAIAFDGNKFVAAGSNYGHAAYSTNGVNWTAITQTETIFGGFINGIAYGGGRFVIVGSTSTSSGIAYAPASDVASWTPVASSPFSDPNNPGSDPTEIFAVAYGNGYFVAVPSRSVRAAYSPDGIIWTAIADTKFGADDAINGIAYGAGKFVMVGANGKVSYAEVK